MKYFKSFMIGVIAVPLILICATMLWSLYTSIQAEAETSSWLVHLQPIQSAIEENAIKQKSLRDAGKGINRRVFPAEKTEFGGIDIFEITESGIIILRGGSDGQVVVLLPSLVEDRVVWRCIGGSRSAMPKKCREDSP